MSAERRIKEIGLGLPSGSAPAAISRVKLLCLIVLAPLFGLPPAALAADSHREAILRLASLSAALVEEARGRQGSGLLAIDLKSRMPAPECGQLFQDVVSLRNVEVLSTGAGTWESLGSGGVLPNLDPAFKQWRDGDGRHLDGYLVVRWRGERELLLRVRRIRAFEQLEVHDKAGGWAACSVLSVDARDGGAWPGKLTPMLLDFPGAAREPARVFPVDPLRSPAAQPLDSP
ncbi:MAG: hypothetical protein K0R40_3342 [Burkholderiales bacterium]|jgi:hypothetical protein|nr:hypothetical protein [Burkholderiales bacterium]